jgi:hypothetical protein
VENKIELLACRIESTERQLQSTRADLRATRIELQSTADRLQRSERRQRATWALAVGGIISAFALGMQPEAQAQFAITLTSLQNQINALTTRVSAVEDKTQFVSVSGGEMFVTGTNLHIRNGLGATNGNPASPLNPFPFLVNGKGNLIVGYNASALGIGGPDDRTGSHNLIVGDGLSYSSFGGLVVGRFSRITGAWASVSGGLLNIASGFGATVSGGSENIASGSGATVSGGFQNVASNGVATVSGGSFITQDNGGGWSAGGSGGAGAFHSP